MLVSLFNFYNYSFARSLKHIKNFTHDLGHDQKYICNNTFNGNLSKVLLGKHNINESTEVIIFSRITYHKFIKNQQFKVST